MEENTVLLQQVEALLEHAPADSMHRYASLANCAAFLGNVLSEINWVGFYLKRPEAPELILGPFWGQVACSVIPINQGVCGHAFTTATIQVVDDVAQFPGHIVCDSASRSEVVLPIWSDQKVVAVLDIDSPKYARFQDADVELLKKIAQLIGSRW